MIPFRRRGFRQAEEEVSPTLRGAAERCHDELRAPGLLASKEDREQLLQRLLLSVCDSEYRFFTSVCCL